MIGANFVCLRVVVGTWLVSVLPDKRVVQQGINLAVFAAAVVLTLWGLNNYLTHTPLEQLGD